MNLDQILKSLTSHSKTDFSRLYNAEYGEEGKKYMQKKNFTCGPAAMSYAMHLMGIEVPQEVLEDGIGTTRKHGTDQKDMINGIRRFGFDADVIYGTDPEKTLDILNQNILDGNTAIIDYLVGNDIKEDGHYAVFLGSTGNKVLTWNPATGKEQAFDRDYFINHWKDETVSGKLREHWALIIKRP